MEEFALIQKVKTYQYQVHDQIHKIKLEAHNLLKKEFEDQLESLNSKDEKLKEYLKLAQDQQELPQNWERFLGFVSEESLQIVALKEKFV